ncbi:MAG: hypothetical protein IPJ39_22870 [Saprospiraceae bacterium]|nr:hypothetical protein [Saprospiraceae bacterium]
MAQFNYNIQRLQPREGQKHAIFLTSEKEKLSFALERNPSDPRISHSINIEIDPFGNVLQSVAIAYGRLTQDAALPSDRDRQKQGDRQIIYSKIDLQSPYRRPIVTGFQYPEVETYELKVANPATNYYQSDEILNAFTLALEKSYEQVITLNEKRKIELVRTLYLKDNLTGSMPFGKMDKRGLPFQNYVLAFTPSMIPHLYGTKVDDVMLRNTANYVRFEGDDNYWVRSGITHFHPDLTLDMNISFVPMATNVDVDFAKKNFFLPAVFEDQVGNLTKVLYDTHKMYMTKMVDALDNEVNVQKFSYRTYYLGWL